ncbi:MAG: SIMPL domain-containing protein [Chitinophagaceae bacterium]|nr:SIMPL domain-containing protein [Chitinophagaceae bacterium]
MKKIISLIMLTGFTATVFAQQPATVNPFPKTITVSGSAEMEIIPDEIYVNITLREYQKKGESKKELETIKTQFLEYCKAAGIPDSVISISSFTGYNNYYNFRRKKKDNDLMASIVYQVKFKDSKTMDLLVEKLDDEATQNFIIASTSHSKMTEFRRQLKIQAIKAAKEKGIYLTEAISEKLGVAITINEPDALQYSGNYLSNNFLANTTYSQSNMTLAESDSGNEQVDFKKIKLRFEVSVIFALQ